MCRSGEDGTPASRGGRGQRRPIAWLQPSHAPLPHWPPGSRYRIATALLDTMNNNKSVSLLCIVPYSGYNECITHMLPNIVTRIKCL